MTEVKKRVGQPGMIIDNRNSVRFVCCFLLGDWLFDFNEGYIILYINQ